MPNIKSSEKRVFLSNKKALQNQMTKSSLKTCLKSFDEVLAGQDKEAVGASFKSAVKKIDQAVAKGLLHKNTAARKKSKLAKKANIAGA